MRYPVEQHIAQTISQHQLLLPAEPVVVGISGGADSVALLVALQALGYQPIGVHVNFLLRGAESLRDEQFVRALCVRLDIPLEVFVHDTKGEAKINGESIEMAARRIRYTRFDEVCKRLNIRHIAVAHHKADNAETLLLNLVRGSGLRGLCGMRYRQDKVIRPCLDIDKALLLDYLRMRNIDYVTDSSNAMPDVKRNRIRLEILPQLEQLNPSIIDTLHDTALRLSESLMFYELGLKQLEEKVVTHYVPTLIYTLPVLHINRSALKKVPSPTTLLHHTLSPYGFTEQQLADILMQQDGQAGAIYLSSEWELHREREVWALYPRVTSSLKKVPLFNGDNTIEGVGVIRVERVPRTHITTLHTSPHVALIDAHKLVGGLYVRHVDAGERFSPLGMHRKQLVSNHLTNAKVPLRVKQFQSAVYDEQGLVWLTGIRLATPYKIEDTTTEVIRLTLITPALETIQSN